MFTKEEEPIISGTKEEIEAFVDCDRCLIVDRRGTEEELIHDLNSFLPKGALTYDVAFPEDDTVEIRLFFQDRKDVITLPFQPQNNFRVLLRIWTLLQPEYDIKIFQCTAGSDTHGFLLRPKEWWTNYQATYPEQSAIVFKEISCLTHFWELDGPIQTKSIKSSPWWKIW